MNGEEICPILSKHLPFKSWPAVMLLIAEANITRVVYKQLCNHTESTQETKGRRAQHKADPT